MGIDKDRLDDDGFPRNYGDHVYTGSMLPAFIFVVAIIAIMFGLGHLLGC